MKNTKRSSLKISAGLVRVVQLHFVLAIGYIAQVIIYDASKLITSEAVLQRWSAIAFLSSIAALIWYLARSTNNPAKIKLLIWLLIVADIAFAAFNVYTQRGMASRAVLLFIIPILVAVLLSSRVALFSTAIFCIAAYTLSAVAYFVNYFNEGYKVELYGEIIFYSFIFTVIAGLLVPLTRRLATRNG